MVALKITAAGVGLYHLAQNARVFLGLVPIFYLGVKISWLSISTPEVVVTGGTTIASINRHERDVFMQWQTNIWNE